MGLIRRYHKFGREEGLISFGGKFKYRAKGELSTTIESTWRKRIRSILLFKKQSREGVTSRGVRLELDNDAALKEKLQDYSLGKKKGK